MIHSQSLSISFSILYVAIVIATITPFTTTKAFSLVTPMVATNSLLQQKKSTSSKSLLFASTLEKPTAADTSTAGASSGTINDSKNDEIPLAPLTKWGQPYEDIVAIQKAAKQQKLPKFSIEIFADDVLSSYKKENLKAEEIELQYFIDHRTEIIQKMQDHGCVIFRNFELMKTPDGFSSFYKALKMNVCCDPLHTVSARPTVALNNNSNNQNQKSPIYEAVNKESRKNFFIGMHNEFVGTRAPAGAAFVCFTAADKGGEFLIADARRIFQNLPQDILQLLYSKQIRYSVIELPFFTWIDTSLIEPLREPVANIIKSIVTFAMNQKVDFDIDLQWITNDESIYNSNKNINDDQQKSSKQRILQARAPKQPPIIEHPITKDPVWFCNVHSHSAQLRQQREKIYGAERFEDGASQINKSDMYYGNDEPLSLEQLNTLNEVTNAQIQYVKMNPGDVVLLDNYKTLHGRNVFDGVRKHAVAWFEGWEQ